MAPIAKLAPNLNTPPSQNTVTVSIINAAHVSGIPTAAFMQPTIPGYTVVDCPAYSFLITRNNPSASESKYKTILFDLAIRKDIENSPQAVLDNVGSMPDAKCIVENDVADVLGDRVGEVDGIIWSHYHFDHTGDPCRFPKKTDLIVGPGFKEKFVPAWPTIKDSPVDERAWEGRSLVEVEMDADLKIGRFKALDFFGDGSFYLLDSPGHATGHLCALVRTKENEFIALGGDVAHHGGEFRPTEYLPLPDEVDPSPLKSKAVCPGHVFQRLHHDEENYAIKPFCWAEGPAHEDAKDVLESVDKWEELDAQENVFAIIAHDATLMDVVDFYPKTANGWREQGWKKEGMWKFLGDYDVDGSVDKKA